ncbi:restriction endonuclease [Methylobacterium sp. GXS13]|uniref:HNH endonuclease n=1 Tax=Methylobacterium sp. GXS13 TaxID=1730094 RepID=UPI00071BC28E|nr:HNH endonuclease [Methylobacterium sp. GXS13]KST59937.1 restriction endonuclease [Methylobacterium sp. GXS13]
MIAAGTDGRLRNPPFPLRSELGDALAEHGYRIGPEFADGWMFARSASTPGEIAVAAASLVGPFFLSVEHAGVGHELGAPLASPPARGHSVAFALTSRDTLAEAVKAAYRLSTSLPTLPLEFFERETAELRTTESDEIVRRRIGQDIFRAALLAYWNTRCPLTGIMEPELLRASHIVPWARCTSDAERLNVHNGLLLSALWDSAFDSGLVTFGDDGVPIVSPRLGAEAAAALNIARTPRLRLRVESQERMRWHRLNIYLS